MSTDRGKFIVFEGLDGAGTSTQMMRLKRWLSERGIFVELTKEPTNGPLGGVIRQVIEERVFIDPVSRALAFASDRVDHLLNGQNGIKAILDRGLWVLCDRYVLSNLAYQRAEGIDLEWLVLINRFAIKPDLTVFIDTSVQNCIERLNRRSSHLELFHDMGRLKSVLDGYKEGIAAGHFLGSLITIDGNNSEERVFADLIGEVQRWLDTETNKKQCEISKA